MPRHPATGCPFGSRALVRADRHLGVRLFNSKAIVRFLPPGHQYPFDNELKQGGPRKGARGPRLCPKGPRVFAKMGGPLRQHRGYGRQLGRYIYRMRCFLILFGLLDRNELELHTT
ncbi:hypothetical protein ANCCEY_04172 [Ancylostoma ceylanicum]|uniref:Uncharacterized protein n=1 Tax=Ancylostoma ceylanicum TaxID=53326 RepID=A0A0D6M335_9BILA|nr:hypothetical protein ANCCEY_04172 [Ancylostoma ceylanicum]